MTKAIFINTNCSVNKGSAAQVISTSETLRALIPNLEITLISGVPDLDSKLCKIHNIKVVSSAWRQGPNTHNRILRFIHHRFFRPFFYVLWAILFRVGLNPMSIKDPIIQEYVSADVIIDLSGDSFSDKGGFSIDISFSILLGLSLKKPIVIYSQSIGPFGWAAKSLAKYCLNKVNLIIVREEMTEEYLKRIGVTNNHLYLTADCAFVLEPASDECIKDILLKENIDITKRPLIGISASTMLDDKNNNYVNSMVQLVDYIIEKLNAQVVFVPHVTGINGRGDDRSIGEKIFNLARNKENISLIQGEYSPEELKGIITLCDMFIGGRMHANIAAISSCVPTIAVAWSHKYYGIMRTVGQEKYVCNFKTMDFEELRAKVDDLWDSREKVREELKANVEEQKKLAWYSAELVRDLLNRRG